MKRLIVGLALAMLLVTSPVKADRAQYMPDLVVTEPGAVWTDMRAYPSDGDSKLFNALEDIGATPTTLVVTENVTLLEATTIPINVTLKFTKNSVITLGAFDLTINSAFSHDRNQCFSDTGAGMVTFGGGAVDYAFPEWWANNTVPGTTDMGPAINSALTAHSYVLLAPCDYFTSEQLLITDSFQKLSGTSINSTNIYSTGNFNVIKAKNTSATNAPLLNTRLNDFSIILSNNNNAVYGVEFYGSSRGVFRSVSVKGNNINTAGGWLGYAYNPDAANIAYASGFGNSWYDCRVTFFETAAWNLQGIVQSNSIWNDNGWYSCVVGKGPIGYRITGHGNNWFNCDFGTSSIAPIYITDENDYGSGPGGTSVDILVGMNHVYGGYFDGYPSAAKVVVNVNQRSAIPPISIIGAVGFENVTALNVNDYIIDFDYPDDLNVNGVLEDGKNKVNFGSVARESGTAGGIGTATFILKDTDTTPATKPAFETTITPYMPVPGMLVTNITDNTYALVTAVDSDSQLTLDRDIMDDGETYTITANIYADLGKANGIGANTNILNDTGQNFLSTVVAGMTVNNTTDGTSTTVSTVTSNDQLALVDDIMDDAEDYEIVEVSSNNANRSNVSNGKWSFINSPNMVRINSDSTIKMIPDADGDSPTTATFTLDGFMPSLDIGCAASPEAIKFYGNDMVSTISDIVFSSAAQLSAEANFTISIDSDNNSTTSEFRVSHNSDKAAGLVRLFYVSEAEGVVVDGDSITIGTSQSPAASSACLRGEIAFDSNYIYVCTSDVGTWKRVALTGGY